MASQVTNKYFGGDAIREVARCAESKERLDWRPILVCAAVQSEHVESAADVIKAKRMSQPY
ncbi:hypothetical protein ACH79_06440 [Bradyrhizobium sp. CCBAU 051011]|nr:hypothetical protein ACH79_06440 [Bradyrhizobium sp. CCBAU 051011]